MTLRGGPVDLEVTSYDLEMWSCIFRGDLSIWIDFHFL